MLLPDYTRHETIKYQGATQLDSGPDAKIAESSELSHKIYGFCVSISHHKPIVRSNTNVIYSSEAKIIV
jgi:hypothetical protein